MEEKKKVLELSRDDVPHVSDVFCICEPRGGGSITVLANAHGRASLQKVFPEWSIPWEKQNSSRFPNDWLLAIFHMPNLASRGGHNLPPITGGAPLEEATPAALAVLLTIAAKDQGARAMMWDEQGDPPLRLFLPASRHN